MNSRLTLQLIAWGIALTLVVLPVVGVLNGWFAAERWPVRQLRVDAEFNHVSAEQIRGAAASHLGTGFFALDLDRVRASVAALPWVEKVEVRKQWPDILELRVLEQQPFARWGTDRLIGHNGTLFSAPGAESIQGVPHLAGPDDRLNEVIDFYTHSQKLFAETGLRVVGVALSERGSWTINLGSGAEVAIGREQATSRLQRFIAVLPRLTATRSDGFERADLRYANGFAIRWQNGAPVPASGKEKRT